MALPKNNLSTLAQPWAREVEKLLVNTQATLSKNETNNVARDAQLAASYRRLDTAVTNAAAAAQDANDAIAGLTSLGSIDSPYTINAGNINAGTLTGVTVQTAATGTRVVMSGTTIDLYYNTSHVGQILGTDASGAAEASFVVPGTGVGFNDGIYISEGAALLKFGDASLNLDTSSSALRANSGLAAFQANTNNTSEIYGALSVYSGATFSAGASVSGNLSTGGSLTRTALATGVSTTCTINGSGQFVRTTSSARYKQDIQPLEVDYDELLSLEPKRFRLKEEAETNPDARFYAGFIAEEIDQTSLKDFVGYAKQEDGSIIPESVYYAEMTAALLAGLKRQDAMIRELQERIDILETK